MYRGQLYRRVIAKGTSKMFYVYSPYIKCSEKKIKCCFAGARVGAKNSVGNYFGSGSSNKAQLRLRNTGKNIWT